MAASLLSLLLLLLLLLLLPLAPAPVSSAQQGLTAGQQVGSAAADGFSPFIFDLAVGTSPQPLSVVMDITSDLVWVQCERCPSSCTRLTPPTTPTFLARNSSSYALVGCDTQICDYMLPVLGEHQCRVQDDNLCAYIRPYYTGTTSGFLATETFSFGATPVKGVVFGCSCDITVPNLDGASGFAGFSRGPLSLVSQLKISSFSYFISPPGDPAGGKNASARTRGHLSWSWGASADYTALQTATTTGGGSSSSSSTLLLPATEHQNPYLYYVNLTGVQVDGQLLTAIPAGTFDVRQDGSGGVYLSTTLPFAYLDKAAYNVLRPELVGRIQSQGVFPVNAAAGGNLDRVCFLTQDLTKAKVSTLALLFDGADAAMELKAENYFFADDDSRQTCLTILPSAATGSVLGSQLQAGRKMTYDIYGNGGGRLTFETAAAGAPVPEWAALMIMATLMWMIGSRTLF